MVDRDRWEKFRFDRQIVIAQYYHEKTKKWAVHRFLCQLVINRTVKKLLHNILMKKAMFKICYAILKYFSRFLKRIRCSGLQDLRTGRLRRCLSFKAVSTSQMITNKARLNIRDYFTTMLDRKRIERHITIFYKRICTFQNLVHYFISSNRIRQRLVFNAFLKGVKTYQNSQIIPA